jgi:hypothetical protein
LSRLFLSYLSCILPLKFDPCPELGILEKPERGPCDDRRSYRRRRRGLFVSGRERCNGTRYACLDNVYSLHEIFLYCCCYWRRDTQRERQISRAFYPRRLSSTLPCPALPSLRFLSCCLASPSRPFSIFTYYRDEVERLVQTNTTLTVKYGNTEFRQDGFWDGAFGMCFTFFLASLCSSPRKKKLNTQVLLKTVGIVGHTRNWYLGAHTTRQHKGSEPSVLPLDSCKL